MQGAGTGDPRDLADALHAEAIGFAADAGTCRVIIETDGRGYSALVLLCKLCFSQPFIAVQPT